MTRAVLRSWGLLVALPALACGANTNEPPSEPTNPVGARPAPAPAPAPAPVVPPAPAPGPATGGSSGSGGSTGPAGSGGEGGTGGSPGAPPTPAGRPRPARFIVLGDSIAACSNIGDENGPDCSLKKLYDHLKARYAPALSYENEAVGAAVTADVPAEQLAGIERRPGHALVLVYVGGNDLARYMFALDSVAEQGLAADLPKVLTAWNQIVTHFQDKARYPDGYTLIMNNQYNPFDDCTAAPYFLTAKKVQLLAMFNTALATLAREKGAQITDQYTPFLGHGHHYQVRSCPHFKADARPFMDDLIHPNAAGHDNLFQQWKAVIDRLYAN
jgi:lysophospholipase L1-like esterase